MDVRTCDVTVFDNSIEQCLSTIQSTTLSNPDTLFGKI